MLNHSKPLRQRHGLSTAGFRLKGLGVRISKGQIITILTANKDVFHAEKDAILEAGLASAAWVTVDDTAARHAGHDEYTTHIGDDRFAGSWPVLVNQYSGPIFWGMELLSCLLPDSTSLHPVS